MDKKNEIKELISYAVKTNKYSYSPYSKFRVSAALKCVDGKIYTGCNVENASYSMCICAERTAFVKALSEGNSKFTSIVILGGHEGIIKDYCPPCGACRQFMSEFCDGDFEIILAKNEDDYKVFKLKELLPESFKL